MVGVLVLMARGNDLADPVRRQVDDASGKTSRSARVCGLKASIVYLRPRVDREDP
jgi:hypothetical protein